MTPVDIPCKRGCPERSATCHACCYRYARYEAWRAYVRAARLRDTDMIHAMAAGAIKAKRRRLIENKRRGKCAK